MPSERHINRQIQWRETLRKYGANVSLERTVHIRRARVVVDVYAEIEGKLFLIEIGDIEDDRKHSLMQYYARENPNIVFVHEPYEHNEIPRVLESIEAYQNSKEYYLRKRRNELIEKLSLQKNVVKPQLTDRQVKIFFGVSCTIVYLLCLWLPFSPPSWNRMNFHESVMFSICLTTFFTFIFGVMWKTRNTVEHSKYDATLEQELAEIEQQLAELEKP